MMTRRQFGRLAAGSVAAASLPRLGWAAKIPDSIHGVKLGLESYSLMPYPQEGIIDLLLATMTRLGIGSCSLQEFLLLSPELRAIVDESGGPDRSGTPNTPEFLARIKRAEDALHDWRTTVSLDSLRAVRKKFDAAGVDLYSYMPNNLRNVANSSDEDLNRACEITRALGAPYMAVMVPKSAAKRLAPIVEKYGIVAGIHGHPSMTSRNPDTIATPADYVEVLSWSKNFRLHFDIGNAAGGGYDVLPFLKENKDKIGGLAVKDRKADGTTVPWGEGDSRVAEVLRLVRDNHLQAHCWIDCTYPTQPGRTRIDDIARCEQFGREALNT